VTERGARMESWIWGLALAGLVILMMRRGAAKG
jgi:hypothetical protein